MSLRARILLLLLAGSGGLGAAQDTDCWRRESGRMPQEWVHDLPTPAELPARDFVRDSGAFIALDEVWNIGPERIYTLIAQVESPAAFADFGDVTVVTGLGEYADIRARVRTPDGRVTEVRRRDIHCSLTRHLDTGRNIGKSVAPKRYIFHFPRLEPGALLQYQVDIRLHEGDPFDWITRYAVLVPLRLGAQWRLAGLDDPRSDPRLRYPAQSLSAVFTVPHGIEFTAGVVPEDGSALIYRQPGESAFISEVVRITAVREAGSGELYAPGPMRGTPWLVTAVSATHPSKYSEEKFAPETWADWVRRIGLPPLLRADADARVAAGAVAAMLHEAASPGPEDARRMCAFVRGREPPESLTRSQWLVGLLRRRGHRAALLYAKPALAPPADREHARHAFVGSYPPVAGLFEDGDWRWYRADGQGPCEGLPSPFQGGEGILIEGRDDWRWIDLPAADPDANGIEFTLRLDPDDGRFEGALEAVFRGASAAPVRDARSLGAGERATVWRRLLADLSGPAVEISEAVEVESRDPDREIRLVARAVVRGELRGADRALRFPLRPGPPAGFAAADARRAAVEFDPPRRFTARVSLPAGTFSESLPLAFSAPGFDYSLDVREAGGRLNWERRLSLAGFLPATAWPELRQALARATAADETPLRIRVR